MTFRFFTIDYKKPENRTSKVILVRLVENFSMAVSVYSSSLGSNDIIEGFCSLVLLFDTLLLLLLDTHSHSVVLTLFFTVDFNLSMVLGSRKLTLFVTFLVYRSLL